MSTFDPANFISQQMLEANDTEYPSIPDGEYLAVSAPITIKSIRTTSKGEVILDIVWNIDDERVKAATGLRNPSARQSIFLDLTESGTIDCSKKKNSSLGQLREVFGMNQSGKPFSLHMLGGQVAKITVKQRLADNGQIYSEVKKVAKAM